MARTRAAAGAKAAAATRSQAARAAVETRTISTKADRAGVLGRIVARSKAAAAKADPLSHVEAARVQQRVANAAAARAKPVYEYDQPTSTVTWTKNQIAEDTQRVREIKEEASRLAPEWKAMEAKWDKTVEKMYDRTLMSRTRKGWGEEAGGNSGRNTSG